MVLCLLLFVVKLDSDGREVCEIVGENSSCYKRSSCPMSPQVTAPSDHNYGN